MSLFALSAISGLLLLDTTAVLQSMVSQPLISGAILGWFSGDLYTGLQIGFLLQLLWLGELPVGAARIPEGNFGSLVGILFGLQYKPFEAELGNVILLVAIVYALICSYFGLKMVTSIRTFNIRLFDRARRMTAAGNTKGLFLVNIAALLVRWAAAVMMVFILVRLGVSLFDPLLPHLSPHWDQWARHVDVGILGAGAGLSLNLFRTKKQRAVIIAAAIAGGLLFFAV